MRNLNLHLVIFDGTSAYVIPSSDFNENDHELLATFSKLEEADMFCDEYSKYI